MLISDGKLIASIVFLPLLSRLTSSICLHSFLPVSYEFHIASPFYSNIFSLTKSGGHGYLCPLLRGPCPYDNVHSSDNPVGLVYATPPANSALWATAVELLQIGNYTLASRDLLFSFTGTDCVNFKGRGGNCIILWF